MRQISKDLEIPIITLSGCTKQFETHSEESFPESGKLKLCNKEAIFSKTQKEKIEFIVENKHLHFRKDALKIKRL